MTAGAAAAGADCQEEIPGVGHQALGELLMPDPVPRKGIGRSRYLPNYWTTTRVPTLTRLNRSVMSALNMRMQP